MVLSLNSGKQARKIGLSNGRRLAAVPFGETVHDQKGCLGSHADGIKPKAEQGQEKRPNKEDSWFGTLPDVRCGLSVAAAGAVRWLLLFPVDQHGLDSTVSRSVFSYPSAPAHGEALESGFTNIPVNPLGVASWKAVVRGEPMEKSSAVDVIKENRRAVPWT
jgi:hypothetical protein